MARLVPHIGLRTVKTGLAVALTLFFANLRGCERLAQSAWQELSALCAMDEKGHLSAENAERPAELGLQSPDGGCGRQLLFGQPAAHMAVSRRIWPHGIAFPAAQRQ